MTREEAIKIINRENDPNNVEVWEVSPEYREALDMAINILKSTPCDDCISRQAAVASLTKTSGIRGDALKALYDLPSVTLQPKIGHWIKYQEPWGGMQGWKCSNCRNHYDVSCVYTIIPYNYCPNCGAKMDGEEQHENNTD